MNQLLEEPKQSSVYSVDSSKQKGSPKVKHRKRVFALAVILLGAATNAARADFTTDLYVTATSNLTLYAFQLDLTLVPVGSTTSFPTFLDPSGQPSAFLDDSNYVFYQQSFAYDNSLPFWLSEQTGPPPYDYPNGEIIGGDETDAAQGYVTLTAGTKYLIGEVTYNVPSPSDTFQVVPTSGGQTYFQDQNSNSYTIMSFNADTGTFTISAVPEPSSSTLLAISSALCGSLWYRGLRKGRTTN